mgnify:CR=1 FL=1
MAVRDQRMRRQHQALAALTRSDPFLRGDVEQALRAINRTACTTLEVARSSIWLYDDEKTLIECKDLYVAADDSHASGFTLRAADYPAYFRALSAERTIAAADAHTHPATQEFSPGYLTPLGIHAMLDAPIFVAGRMVGVVCQEQTGGPRVWELDEELFVGSIADMVAMALESSRLSAAAALAFLTFALRPATPAAAMVNLASCRGQVAVVGEVLRQCHAVLPLRQCAEPWGEPIDARGGRAQA